MKISFNKNVLLAGILLLLAQASGKIWAQAPSANADDEFYSDAQIWETLGIIDTLPNLRPYPLHLIRTILEQAAESDNDAVSETAREYYEKIFGSKFHGFVGAKGMLATSSVDGETEKEKNLLLDVNVAGSVQTTELLSYAYDFGISARKNPIIQPFATNLEQDTIFDPATFGPFSTYTDVNMGLGFGRDDIYINTGLFRSGYGPFLNHGLALNDSAYHQANIAFAFIRPTWNYVHQLSAIGATDMTGSLGSLTHSKFSALHAIEFKIHPKFSLSYYETMVWGHRFDFTYALPIMYYIGQNISGASDNLQMGLLGQFRAFEGFNWATDIFIDDFDLNEIGKGNLDSKYRFGIQTGVIYTPKNSIITKITGGYTLQSPYLYAHWDYDGVSSDDKSYSKGTINFQNYTNAGQILGSPLPPNSDRIALEVKLRPVQNLRLSLAGAFIRHANVCQGYSDDEAWWYLSKGAGLRSDGSLYSSQMWGGTDKKVNSAWHKLSLLSQDDVMRVFQAGLQAEYEFPLKSRLRLSLKAGYMFEYVQNAGVDSDIWRYNEGYDKKYYGENSESLSDDERKALVQSAYDAWRDALYNVVNNYFSVSVKVAY